MKLDPDFARSGHAMNAISPFLEMGAYEALWSRPGATFRSLAERFARHPGSVPSDFVPGTEARACATFVRQRFDDARIGKFGVRIHGTGAYPDRLRDAAYPVALLYFQGFWNLACTRSVAVIGTRKPSREGIARTRRLVQSLVANGVTVVSGLAAGIDRIAHETAIREGGRTIAVIGTPLPYAYPRENHNLQRHIAERHLLISQIPLKRYESQDWCQNRRFFPERNATMSALTEATIIVEAGETSGTLVQARAALRQGRMLFVPDSCFRNPDLT